MHQQQIREDIIRDAGRWDYLNSEIEILLSGSKDNPFDYQLISIFKSLMNDVSNKIR